MSSFVFILSGYSKAEVDVNHKVYKTELTTRRRLIVFLEDGARPDYLFLNSSVLRWKPFFSNLLKSDPKHTVCSTMKVDPPTSTTQGVKTLLTGGMRSFLELGQTFFSSSLTSDHWLRQLKSYRNLSIAHTGDYVWRELGGDVFSNDLKESDSFDVYVDDTEDIQEALESFVTSTTDVLIIHSLLVDHNAHRTSTSSPSHHAIYDALLKFNKHLSYITSHLPTNTLLLVFGDHGLSAWRNHGGATYDEVTTGICAYSSSYELQPFTVGESFFYSS